MELENDLKILKLYPSSDVTYPNFLGKKYNYHINYGVWDKIEGDKILLENTNVNLTKYDVVFLPMVKRWENPPNIRKFINKIKVSGIKTVLFDNDSCYRSFNQDVYDKIDLILYRDLDKNKNKPNTESMWHPWSIDTSLYTPVYGNNNISFNCSVNRFYPLRQQISKIIKNTNYQGKEYIKCLQNSAASIHTDSTLVPMVRAKALEMAACGAQIISNRTEKMDYFFPDDLILYFNGIEDLKKLISNYTPNVESQKKLRRIVETKHDNKIRAMEIIDAIKKIL
jgi:hypothetical protein